MLWELLKHWSVSYNGKWPCKGPFILTHVKPDRYLTVALYHSAVGSDKDTKDNVTLQSSKDLVEVHRSAIGSFGELLLNHATSSHVSHVRVIQYHPAKPRFIKQLRGAYFHTSDNNRPNDTLASWFHSESGTQQQSQHQAPPGPKPSDPSHCPIRLLSSRSPTPRIAFLRAWMR